MDIYFQQEWIDERLMHNESHRMLLRDKTVFDRLWHPDVHSYVVNTLLTDHLCSFTSPTQSAPTSKQSLKTTSLCGSMAMALYSTIAGVLSLTIEVESRTRPESP